MTTTPTTTKTRVVNLKGKKKEDFDGVVVYIGRYHPKWGSSKWGNPFKIGKDGTREEVIEKFRQYLLSRPDLMAQIPELKGKTLGCWCKPNACHGDVIVEFADE